MEIYGRANAWNVRKVTFLAEDLGIPYHRMDYGRGFAATDTPEFLALNPNGTVPVLVDGDVTLWESHAILRYLGAKYGPASIFPHDLKQRAQVDQWLDWKAGQVTLPMRLLFFMRYLNSTAYSDKEVRDAEAELIKLYTILNGQLSHTGAYVTGADFTIADCAIGMAVHRWLQLRINRPHLPDVDRYYALMSERPSYQKTVLIGIP